ncbi:YidC/Oxa1 family insertase periplasmic-domain containing protein [bacterium]|nr:YidC/Oxa1 family insertase periplasmic-domain containing protein [bacterium]
MRKFFELGFLHLILFLFFSPWVQCSAAFLPPPPTTLKDVDGDNLNDACIETPKLRVIFSSRTGNISLYYLKGVNFEENLIPPQIQDKGYLFASSTINPFEVVLGANDSEQTLTPAGYNIVFDESPSNGDFVVVATANSPAAGVGLTKRYSFKLNSYTFGIEAIVSNLTEKSQIFGNEKLGNSGLKMQYGPGIFLEPFDNASLIALKKDLLLPFETLEDLSKQVKDQSNSFTGIGLKTIYFCLLLEATSPGKLSLQKFEVKSNNPREPAFQGEVLGISYPPFSLKSKESKSFSFNCYFGPKLLDELKLINRELVTDYGFLSTMLLRILQFFYSIYPNYGMSIIFLTIFVRLLLYPLTIKSTKSMAKVQKIQPLVQDLKDRYRDNTQKFNEEVLKLYQKHQVNPLGGCLPIFLQLPVFIALYNTIHIAVELRKTSFLWISDLSKTDPLLILPITIAILMYYQQTKMNAPPEQQQMMSFMVYKQHYRRCSADSSQQSHVGD